MKTQRSGVFPFILTFVLLIVLVRFLPLIIRILQMFFMGFRMYWWAILPLLVWIIWRRKKKRDFIKSSYEVRELRDVTNSAKGV